MELLTDIERSLVYDEIEVLRDREAWMRSVVEPLAHLDLTKPSVLPGWSIAHVLVHLARNADSHRRRIEASARGDMVDQYVGGIAGRICVWLLSRTTSHAPSVWQKAGKSHHGT